MKEKIRTETINKCRERDRYLPFALEDLVESAENYLNVWICAFDPDGKIYILRDDSLNLKFSEEVVRNNRYYINFKIERSTFLKPLEALSDRYTIIKHNNYHYYKSKSSTVQVGVSYFKLPYRLEGNSCGYIGKEKWKDIITFIKELLSENEGDLSVLTELVQLLFFRATPGNGEPTSEFCVYSKSFESNYIDRFLELIIYIHSIVQTIVNKNSKAYLSIEIMQRLVFIHQFISESARLLNNYKISSSGQFENCTIEDKINNIIKFCGRLVSLIETNLKESSKNNPHISNYLPLTEILNPFYNRIIQTLENPLWNKWLSQNLWLYNCKQSKFPLIRIMSIFQIVMPEVLNKTGNLNSFFRPIQKAFDNVKRGEVEELSVENEVILEMCLKLLEKITSIYPNILGDISVEKLSKYKKINLINLQDYHSYLFEEFGEMLHYSLKQLPEETRKSITIAEWGNPDFLTKISKHLHDLNNPNLNELISCFLSWIQFQNNLINTICGCLIQRLKAEIITLVGADKNHILENFNPYDSDSIITIKLLLISSGVQERYAKQITSNFAKIHELWARVKNLGYNLEILNSLFELFDQYDNEYNSGSSADVNHDSNNQFRIANEMLRILDLTYNDLDLEYAKHMRRVNLLEIVNKNINIGEKILDYKLNQLAVFNNWGDFRQKLKACIRYLESSGVTKKLNRVYEGELSAMFNRLKEKYFNLSQLWLMYDNELHLPEDCIYLLKSSQLSIAKVDHPDIFSEADREAIHNRGNVGLPEGRYRVLFSFPGLDKKLILNMVKMPPHMVQQPHAHDNEQDEIVILCTDDPEHKAYFLEPNQMTSIRPNNDFVTVVKFPTFGTHTLVSNSPNPMVHLVLKSPEPNKRKLHGDYPYGLKIGHKPSKLELESLETDVRTIRISNPPVPEHTCTIYKFNDDFFTREIKINTASLIIVAKGSFIVDYKVRNNQESTRYTLSQFDLLAVTSSVDLYLTSNESNSLLVILNNFN